MTCVVVRRPSSVVRRPSSILSGSGDKSSGDVIVAAGASAAQGGSTFIAGGSAGNGNGGSVFLQTDIGVGNAGNVLSKLGHRPCTPHTTQPSQSLYHCHQRRLRSTSVEGLEPHACCCRRDCASTYVRGEWIFVGATSWHGAARCGRWRSESASPCSFETTLRFPERRAVFPTI